MKRSSYTALAVLLGLLVVASACSQSEAGVADAYLRTSPGSVPQPQYYIGNPPGEGILATSDLGNPEWEEASIAYTREAGPWFVEGRKAIDSDDPVLARHERIQEVFATQMSPEAEWFVKTNLSLLAIDAFARADAPPETFAPYVEHLVAVGNPNADAVLRGLERLDGTWDQARLASAATSARDAGAAYLSKTCGDCGEGDAAYREGRSDRERDISAALVRLEVLGRA